MPLIMQGQNVGFHLAGCNAAVSRAIIVMASVAVHFGGHWGYRLGACNDIAAGISGDNLGHLVRVRPDQIIIKVFGEGYAFSNKRVAGWGHIATQAETFQANIGSERCP